jgi:hypothetical protein
MSAGGEKIVKKSKKIAKTKPKQAMAIHKTDGSTHIVGIGNLRVIICQDGDSWFAQGLEIDYAANGHSLDEVKKNFQTGLKGTIDLHIKAYGNIEHFLRVAPQEVWKELHTYPGTNYRYTQVSLHEDLLKTLGYQGINFIEPGQELVA